MRLKRLIPVLFLKNGVLVRSENFKIHQVLGNIISEAKRYSDWNVDELFYVDISRDNVYDGRRDDHRIHSFNCIEDIITGIAKVCHMPLTFGGGIRTMKDVDLRIRTGADKIVINTSSYDNPNLLTQIIQKYGSQCLVISVDYKMINNEPIFHVEYGTRNTGVNVFDWIKECERLGAGEIILHAIDRDGKATGYDIETIGHAAELTPLPVVALGGAGTMDDFYEVFTMTGASAVAAGNIFHFTERSYPRAKRMLIREGLHVRR